MFGLFLLGVAVVPLVLGYVLRKTIAWWLPGAGLIAGAIVIVATLPDPGHGEASAPAALGNGIEAIFAMVLGGYGLALLLASGASRLGKRKPAPVQPQLPVAIAQSTSSDKNAK
ncbi:MAG TPA: hypothetical protein VMJ10_01320 [Kofleriaceae bacterium]|nr:hypothetical protein [Kofleriaceae bacterium]